MEERRTDQGRQDASAAQRISSANEQTPEFFRQKALAARRQLSDEERRSKSENIAGQIQALFEDEPLLLSQPILCFYPFPDEVDLRGLYEALLKNGQRLYFPITKGTEVSFYRISSMERFREGTFHVLEPEEREEVFSGEEPYIAITPGVAFDRNANRIGFGKGCYDRFFAANPDGFRIGVAFAVQIFEVIATIETDIPMHRILFA